MTHAWVYAAVVLAGTAALVALIWVAGYAWFVLSSRPNPMLDK